MLGQTGQSAKIRDRTWCPNQMVVRDDVRMGPEAGSGSDGSPSEVDGLHVANVNMRVFEEPAKRADDIREADGS